MSDHEKFVFDISPFHFLEFCLKQLQLQSTQTAIFEQFFETRSMDTNSSNNSSSSYCFLLELCAREAASLGAIGHGDSVGFSTLGSPIVEAIFKESVFSNMVSNGASNDFKNGTKSDKQHVENVPNWIPLDLQETTRGADKYKQISKHCVEMKPKSMKNRPRNSKRCLKTDAKQSKQKFKK